MRTGEPNEIGADHGETPAEGGSPRLTPLPDDHWATLFSPTLEWIYTAFVPANFLFRLGAQLISTGLFGELFNRRASLGLEDGVKVRV